MIGTAASTSGVPFERKPRGGVKKPKRVAGTGTATSKVNQSKLRRSEDGGL